jgi:hypothetical protein
MSLVDVICADLGEREGVGKRAVAIGVIDCSCPLYLRPDERGRASIWLRDAFAPQHFKDTYVG